MVDKEYILSKNNSYSLENEKDQPVEDAPSNDAVDVTENLNPTNNKDLSSYDVEEDKQFYQE